MKYTISKTHGGYWRVYRLTAKFAIPFSPKEFLKKSDAKKWLANKRGK